VATINKIDEIKINDKFSKSYDLGYKNLDALIGGLKDGNIITVGSRPGMGKTTFLNNIVINLLKKYNLPILYLSLETSKEIAALKFAGICTEQDLVKIWNNKDYSEISMNEFISKKYNLYISDDCFNILELEQLLEENRDIKFIVIDYIQLMKNEKPFTSVTDLSNDILDRLRYLTTKYKTIIFISSQLSRNVEYRENKRPLLVDLKNTGNLECNSDVVILLYRDYDNKNITEISVSKNRFCSVGITYLEYDKEKSTFIEY